MKRRWHAGLALCLALCGIACGSSRDERPPAPGNVMSNPDCPVPDGPCDVRRADCQSAVLALTACVRGDANVPLPPLRVITPAQFRDELTNQVSATGSDTLTDAALVALHLLPAGMTSTAAAVEAQAQGVVAFYDDENKGVTIIDGGQLGDQQEAMYELSHELTHYLQDQTVGIAELTKQFPRTNDGVTAARNLIEGEAVVNSTRALAMIMQRAVNRVPWGQLFENLDRTLLSNVNAASARLQTAALILPYAVGTRYVGQVWNGYDRAHVDDLFAQAPRAVVDWLAGYGQDMPAPTLVEALDCGPPEAPSGYVLEVLDSFGPTGALALLAAAEPASDLTLTAALRGDAIAVYDKPETGDSSVLVAWRLRFDTADSAREFASIIGSLGFSSRVFGSEVVLSATGDPAHNPLTGSQFDACPKLDQLHPRMAADSGRAALRRGLPHHLAFGAIDALRRMN